MNNESTGGIWANTTKTNKTQKQSSMNPASMLKVGMNYDEVVSILGQPTATNSGAEILGVKARIVASNQTRSQLSNTKYCVWRRPEGEYRLIFSFGCLARMRTPSFADASQTNESVKPDYALGRIIVIAFAENPMDPNDACRQAIVN